LVSKDEADGAFYLPRGIFGEAERRIFDGRPIHLRVAVGMAETVEV